ncbi:MAG: DUF362 domain-containing protein [Verrucomicrobia bacterium]|nr:DUF362 domain-containing protein [Verrucomicrobiota bacterium]
MKHYTRRDFLRGTAAGALGASMGLCPRDVAFAAEPGEAKSRVILIRDERAMRADNTPDARVVETMLNKAVCRLAGKDDPAAAWKTYLHPDDTVGIKVTLYMISTHKEVIDAVRAGAQKAGVPDGKILVGDRGNSPGKDTPVTALVNVPSLKAHHMSGIGCVIKNYIVYHPQPASLHPDSCAELGAAWEVPAIKGKTRLVVVDGLFPLFDKGPQVTPKYRWPYGGILVGTDPVAVDAVCLRILQAKRDAFRGEPWPLNPPPKSLAVADTKYHLGTSAPEKIHLLKLGWDRDAFV